MKRAGVCTERSETIRELLERVRVGALECMALCEEADRYRELATQCTQALTGMPGSGDKTGRQERFVVPLLDVQIALQERARVLTEERAQAERIIDALEDEKQRIVMRLYYLCGLSMEEISDKTNYDRSWAYRLRSKALEQIEKDSGH